MYDEEHSWNEHASLKVEEKYVVVSLNGMSKFLRQGNGGKCNHRGRGGEMVNLIPSDILVLRTRPRAGDGKECYRIVTVVQGRENYCHVGVTNPLFC